MITSYHFLLAIVLCSIKRRCNTYRVSIDILGNRVDNNARPIQKRILHIGTTEGSVDGHGNSVGVGNRGSFANINQSESWIGMCLNPDKFSLTRSDHLLQVLL